MEKCAFNGYKVYKLDNGLVVALHRLPTQTVSGKLRVNFGPVNERAGEEGLSHFLEHCIMVGGSQKYTPEEAREKMSDMHGTNASTTEGRIMTYSSMLPEDMGTWLDISSDHIFKPRLDKSKVEGERKVVLREIADSKGELFNEGRALHDLFYRGHPKGIYVLGKEEVIENTSISHLGSFHGRGFHPNNMDLILVGGLPGNTEELVNQYFGQVPIGENTRTTFPELEPLKTKAVVQTPLIQGKNPDRPEESSANIRMIFQVPSDLHPDCYTARVTNQILGDNLFRNIREKRGLAYRAYSSYNGTFNVGEIKVTTKVDARKIDEAVAGIFEEIQRLKSESINENELRKIKNSIRFSSARTFESPEGHLAALELLLDEGLTIEQTIEGFEKVTSKDILRFAKTYFPNREDGNYLMWIRNPLIG